MSNARRVQRNFSGKRDLPLSSDKNEFAVRQEEDRRGGKEKEKKKKKKKEKRKEETRTRIRKSNVGQLSRSLGNDDIFRREFRESP